jgi:hypothetical protein
MTGCSIAGADAAQYGGAIGGIGASSSCALNGVSFTAFNAPLGTILYGNKYTGIDGAPVYTVGPGCFIGGTELTLLNFATTLQPSMVHLINGAGITPDF